MTDGPQKKTSLGFHLAAGLGSGVASAFLLQPADLLKTRVQQSNGGSLRKALRDVLNGPNPVRQLWRGTAPSVIRTGAGSALYFGLLNQMREHVAKIPAIIATPPDRTASSSSALPKLGNVANLTTGALARVAAGFMMNPVTVLKVRFESTHYSYTSLAGAAQGIVRTEGLRGFFAGFGATAIRDAPYAGLYVLIYEQAKLRLATLSAVVAMPDGETAARSMGSSASINFMSGVVAATTATTLTNPFDAIKTRLQIAPGKYRNMVQAAKTMMKEEGFRSMLNGLSLRIGRKAISSALTWTVYEELIRRSRLAM
ncbi:probable Solute carrier family 25 member 38 homolog [Ramularia collo-cygni]|uniref:Mitochondrial glycine transporter n=1 Tax=Ramularia collo-cygni TaxID=112498 RepID=A0A2D3VJ93_9PEZI|nr:probable Solute carrier family 25 member 38 homolog [Ramularia collo-cygni]CZT24441.1 probable Solute carrier family 25 member 38 homolog [Ramularia collo-cygni]